MTFYRYQDADGRSLALEVPSGALGRKKCSIGKTEDGRANSVCVGLKPSSTQKTSSLPVHPMRLEPCKPPFQAVSLLVGPPAVPLN
jgi:hypothetical protein